MIYKQSAHCIVVSEKSTEECSGGSENCTKDIEGLVFAKDTLAGFSEKEPKVITFDCDKVIINDKQLESVWPSGVPLNFEDYDTLVFSGNGKKYTYKKV